MAFRKKSESHFKLTFYYKLSMYYYKLFDPVEIFDGCKSQIFVIGDKNVGRGIRNAEA